MVEKLLYAGAKANGLEVRKTNVDYHSPPLVICMSAKLHRLDLEVEGLTYKKKISAHDVDYEACMRHLLKYKADSNVLLLKMRRKPRPIFHAVKCSFRTLKLLLDFSAERVMIVN